MTLKILAHLSLIVFQYPCQNIKMFQGKLWSIAQLIPLNGELDECSVKAEQCYHPHYQTAENHKAYA